ncbi:hypothetical protein CAEBREN_04798 [Caenorhabditis brenneri]|uniref:Uncharacterized protein n=1 Tax=Caenorhabditis brenneri TaxID=135651 RepID=G0NYQ2_CAEBE|nr:hypothetical protein CAEBREN_04798 [Caenorhabditis brenneri]
MYLTPENTQLVEKLQSSLQQDENNALRKMFPLDQQTDQFLDKLINLPDNITPMQKYVPCNVTYIGNVFLSRNGGKNSSATLVAKRRTESMKLISLTPNDPDIDRYLKKNYKEIKEIKVDEVAKKSSIHQRKDEVVFTIRITPDKDSTTGYIVDEGVICEDSNC